MQTLTYRGLSRARTPSRKTAITKHMFLYKTELRAPRPPQAHLCAFCCCFTNRSRTLLLFFYSDAFGVAAAISLCTLTIYTFFLEIANLIGIHATPICSQFSLQTRAAPRETAAAPLAFYCERATALQ